MLGCLFGAFLAPLAWMTGLWCLWWAAHMAARGRA